MISAATTTPATRSPRSQGRSYERSWSTIGSSRLPGFDAMRRDWMSRRRGRTTRTGWYGMLGVVVLLVPRQIRMAGMTGDVPYYGGRFTPRQAYAAAHPPPPASSPAPAPPPAARSSRPPRPPRAGGTGDPAAALQDLLDAGVITQEEFDGLAERLDR